ncbi:diflavin oxidoreductase [Anaerophaga thermohalophila]|uniref:diflavin oxidoreductase n=1 Tax=Anaerophaga thermohalophila TaxID=177400 RepID=UPI0002FCF6C4|nr:flavodoxin domain-containing protein [Anaerophaga thermohalophila]
MIKKTLLRIFNIRNEIPEVEITILYGTKSGNSAFIAKEAAKYFKMQGVETKVENLSKYQVAQLATESTVFIVISTHGEGNPPPGASSFFNELIATDISIDHLDYAVCALGDSGYQFFCQAGKTIDQRFSALGANPLLSRVDCDVNFREVAASWIKNAYLQYKVKKTKIHSAPAAITSCSCPGSSSTEAIGQSKIDECTDITTPTLKNNTHQGIIKHRFRLNPDSSSGIYHIVIDIDPGKTKYTPGDSISVIPGNPAPLIDKILYQLNVSWNHPVTFKRHNVAFGELLQTKLEITTLHRESIKRYAEATKNVKLKSLSENEVKITEYLKNKDMLDLITDFPARLSPEEIINIPEEMRPRHYSVASSQCKTPGELHLTVKQIGYSNKKRTYYGACSTYLTSWLKTGSEVQFKLAPNENFRLPSGSGIPVIMIAAGTGIAPFISFLHHRSVTNATKNWLIFGEKTRKSDFLYKNQLIEFERKGFLRHLDLAFSRDNKPKQYVQDKIIEKSTLLSEWIENGAHIYVCGSIKMGQGIKETLNQLPLSEIIPNKKKPSNLIDYLRYKGQYFEDLY